MFPVHALGDRFDHQITFADFVQIGFVVGRFDVCCVRCVAKRCRAEFFQIRQCLFNDAVFSAFFGRQVKQDHWNFGIDQVRGNLRTHHARAENGDFTDD